MLVLEDNRSPARSLATYRVREGDGLTFVGEGCRLTNSFASTPKLRHSNDIPRGEAVRWF